MGQANNIITRKRSIMEHKDGVSQRLSEHLLPEEREFRQAPEYEDRGLVRTVLLLERLLSSESSFSSSDGDSPTK